MMSVLLRMCALILVVANLAVHAELSDKARAVLVELEERGELTDETV